ncbi:unnamed protein product [Victoria cruziana]
MESSRFATAAIAAVVVATAVVVTASAAGAPAPAPASDASTYAPAVAFGVLGSLGALLFGNVLC